MLKTDKKILHKSEDKRDNYNAKTLHLRFLKKQRAKKQLATQNQYLTGKNYTDVLSKKTFKALMYLYKNHKIKVNIYNDKQFELAKELIKLNLAKTVESTKSHLVLKITSLGKTLLNKADIDDVIHKCKINEDRCRGLGATFTSIFFVVLVLVILAPFGFMNTFLPCLCLIIFGIGLPVDMIFIGKDIHKYSQKYYDYIHKSHHLTNKKALVTFKKILKSSEYQQEYLIFKHYAEKKLMDRI